MRAAHEAQIKNVLLLSDLHSKQRLDFLCQHLYSSTARIKPLVLPGKSWTLIIESRKIGLTLAFDFVCRPAAPICGPVYETLITKESNHEKNH